MRKISKRPSGKTPTLSVTVKMRDGSKIILGTTGTHPLPEELPPEMDFAKTLREAIRKSGISQYRLAKMSGVPQPGISVFLSGGDVRLQTFNRLAACLGFDLKQDRRKVPKVVKPDKPARKPARKQ